jgi:hypothetical protein
MAAFDTLSYQEFATDFHVRRDHIQWMWDQYLPDIAMRSEIFASPLRATAAQLAACTRPEPPRSRDRLPRPRNRVRSAGACGRPGEAPLILGRCQAATTPCHLPSATSMAQARASGSVASAAGEAGGAPTAPTPWRWVNSTNSYRGVLDRGDTMGSQDPGADPCMTRPCSDATPS